jgi:hypothetical protein
MKEIIGKTIQSVLVNADESRLRFVCDDGPVTFEVEGDCCSNSWFADLIGYQALVRHRVADVYEVELTEGNAPPLDVPSSGRLTAEGRTRQDSDEIYGYVITTDAGRCTVAFRNSSNGYYGGSCGVTTADDLSWKPIEDDWSAS